LSCGKTKLKEGMMLCVPSHGPGKVIAIEKKEILGEKCIFCKIEFSSEDMSIFVPLNKMKEMGIRTIISSNDAKKILANVLNKHARGSKGIWAKRMQEYEVKLYSGNAIFIAEIVRDLFAGMKDPSKSYGERAIYEKAFGRLALEFSLALNVTIEEANRMIIDVLEANYASSRKSEVAVNPLVDNDTDDFADEDVDQDDDMEEEEENSSKKKIA